jgi:16S rRNA (uracil1498-N3)-methyltransferase
MKIHRFFIENEIALGVLTVTEQELLNQWHKVLRLTVGDRLNLIGSNNLEGEAVIKGIKKGATELQVENTIPTVVIENEINLFVAILKKENFELVVQKATEVGVKSITPIITERTVKLGLSLSRLEKIIKEASEQSGRGEQPTLNEALPLNKALQQTKEDCNVALSLEGETAINLPASTPLNLWVGPEGGFTTTEEESFKQHNFELKSLGELTLRGETAAIVGSYLAVNNLL